MPELNDQSRSHTVLKPDSTLIAVLEMTVSISPAPKPYKAAQTGCLPWTRIASRRNAPELIVRCLTPMFPTLTLAQRRVPAPDRA